jgi:hypothetical protein
LSIEEELASGEMNGIAHDEASHRFYLTGKLWPKLFEVSIPLSPEYSGGTEGGGVALGERGRLFRRAVREHPADVGSRLALEARARAFRLTLPPATLAACALSPFVAACSAAPEICRCCAMR